jgi:hypothetical protein
MLGRFLATDGLMGEYPFDYVVVKAAKYLGVAPWDLIKQPLFWRQRALMFMRAEASGRKQKEAHGG